MKTLKLLTSFVGSSLRRMVLRIWWGMVNRECWKCAHRLIALGQDNGSAQEHIDAAKDALYRAAAAAEAEREDAQNDPALATRGLEPAPENHAGDGQPSGLPAAHGSASEKSPITPTN